MSDDIKKYINIINEQTRGHVMPNVTTVDPSAPWIKKQMHRAAEFTKAMKSAADNRERLNLIQNTDLTTVKVSFGVSERYNQRAAIYEYNQETGDITLIVGPAQGKVWEIADSNINNFSIGMERGVTNIQTYYFEIPQSKLTNFRKVPNPRFATYKQADRRRNKNDPKPIPTASIDALSSMWNTKK